MDPCRMCLRCLPFFSHTSDSPPPSPTALPEPPSSDPSHESQPSCIAAETSLTADPDHPSTPPVSSDQESYPPLQLPVNDFEFPAALPSAPVTPALIGENSQTGPDPSSSVLPISTLESFQSAPELDAHQNDEKDPQLDTSHSEPISEDYRPPGFTEDVEALKGHHHHHHHHYLTQQLHDFAHQLKEQGNQLKEEGSRHLNSVLNNLKN